MVVGSGFVSWMTALNINYDQTLDKIVLVVARTPGSVQALTSRGRWGRGSGGSGGSPC